MKGISFLNKKVCETKAVIKICEEQEEMLKETRKTGGISEEALSVVKKTNQKIMDRKIMELGKMLIDMNGFDNENNECIKHD